MIAKNTYWLKWICLFFLIVSLFLFKINETSAFTCTTIFWTILSLIFVSRIDRDRFLLRFLALVFLLTFALPLVFHLALVNSEGVNSFFTSPAADQAAFSFQRTCEELLKCKKCILAMIETKDVRQMNENLVWYLFLPGFTSVLFFLANAPKAFLKAMKTKKTEK